MAKTMQELVGMESPFEASLKAVGYKAPETKEQEKYIKEKSEADEAVAKGKTRIAEESLKTREELYARPDLQKQKIEAFAPSPESGSDLAKLFALTTAITFFGGGKGRYSGQAAMGNLASAMDGYKKGRKDLFAQEMKEYDKNMKSAMENNKLIEDKLKEYLDLAAKKDESALVKLAEVQALTGRQGGLAQIEKMSGENLAKHAETLGKARADWIKHVMDIQNKAADRDAAAFEIYQDKDGNLVRVNKRTGAAQPIADSQGLVKPGKAGAAGTTGAKGNVAGAVERMTQSMGQASDALTNLARLPVTTSNPIYGQSSFNSLFTAPLSVLNQKMSDDTSQMMKTRMAAVSRTLASLETGGAATGLVGLTKSIEDGVAIPAGSSLVVALDKLAEMRRIVETSSRIALSSPNYSPSQKDEIQKSLSLVRTAIPYTQEDLDLAIRTSQGKGIKLQSGEKNMTFTEFVNQHGLGEKPSASTPPDNLDEERSKAKAAIAAGAPEDSVRERFKQKTGKDL